MSLLSLLIWLAILAGSFSASQIYEAVWAADGEHCGTAVASVIGQIRRKLTPDTPKGGYIRTVLGSGYKFNSSPFLSQQERLRGHNDLGAFLIDLNLKHLIAFNK